MAKLTNAEIAARRPVWVALSDLFLDTDVSLSYEYTAQICARSEYTLDELKQILINEVAPVVSVNLFSMAGEWAGFDEEWLVAGIRHKMNSQSPCSKAMTKLFRRFVFKHYIHEHWRAVAQKIIALREGD